MSVCYLFIVKINDIKYEILGFVEDSTNYTIPENLSRKNLRLEIINISYEQKQHKEFAVIFGLFFDDKNKILHARPICKCLPEQNRAHKLLKYKQPVLTENIKGFQLILCLSFSEITIEDIEMVSNYFSQPFAKRLKHEAMYYFVLSNNFYPSDDSNNASKIDLPYKIYGKFDTFYDTNDLTVDYCTKTISVINNDKDRIIGAWCPENNKHCLNWRRTDYIGTACYPIVMQQISDDQKDALIREFCEIYPKEPECACINRKNYPEYQNRPETFSSDYCWYSKCKDGKSLTYFNEQHTCTGIHISAQSNYGNVDINNVRLQEAKQITSSLKQKTSAKDITHLKDFFKEKIKTTLPKEFDINYVFIFGGGIFLMLILALLK